MNKETRIRTVLVVATCINTALMSTDIAQFGNATANTIYKIISLVLNFIIVACATYFNNDYSEEAALGTGYARQLKAESKADYAGENFFEEEDKDEEENEEDEDDEEA